MDFRTEYARHPDDPSYQQLIDELTERNELLRSWILVPADDRTRRILTDAAP
jgi:hypothetical protein